MTKFSHFKGEVHVDFETVPSLSQKIKEFTGISLHKDDYIIGIKLSVGEYHHNAKRGPHFFLKIQVCNKREIKQSEKRIKEINSSITPENFFKLFKSLDLFLDPHNHAYED